MLSSSTRLNSGTGGGGGGTIGGSIAATEIAYGSSADTITGDPNATRVPSGQFQTDISSPTYALGPDTESNFPTNGLYRADTLGAAGNSIMLTFDGTSDTYDSVLLAWNAANPSNTATLIAGTGTDIPDAQTISFSGGGTAGLSIGTVPGISLQGSAMFANDPTNGTNVISGAANSSPLTGHGGLSGITFAGNGSTISASIVGPDSVNIVNTDESTYQSQFRADSDGVSMGQNALEMTVSSANGISWGDRNSNTQYFLPTGTMPTTGEVLGVTGIVGSSYQLDFVAGSSTAPGGSNQDVQFNDSGSFGGSDNFTWDNANFDIQAGDLSDSVGGVWFRTKNASGLFEVNGMQGAGTPVFTGITFTGSGLDDMTSVNGTYAGPTPQDWTVTIDAQNQPWIRVNILTGTLVAGDTVTDGTSGATATVVSSNMISSDLSIVLGSVSGTFSNGDSISGGSGFTGTVNTFQTLDTYTIVDLTNAMTIGSTIPCDGTTPGGIAGFYGQPTFGIQIGHTIGDFWSFGFTPGPAAFGLMLSLNGQGHDCQLGDVNNLVGGSKVQVASGLGIRDILAPGNSYSLQDAGTGEIIGAAGNFGNPTVTIGAFGYGNDTGITVDDADQIIILNTNEQLTTNSNSFFNATNSFSLRNPSNTTQTFMEANWNSGNPHFEIGGQGNGTQLVLDDNGQRATFNNLDFFQVLNGVDSFINGNWASGNPNVVFGADGYGNNTFMSLDDSSGVVYVSTDTSFTVRNTSGDIVMYAQNDAGDHRFRAGDVSGSFGNTLFDVSDSNQNYTFSKPNFVIDSVPYVMPSFQGAASTVLINDGTGNLIWDFPLGAGQVNHVRKVTTSPDFVSGTDYCLLMDTTSTAFSETLPAATSLGRTYVIKDYAMNAGVNNIEIFPTGSDTIDFAASLGISVNGGSVTLIADGISNWSVL